MSSGEAGTKCPFSVGSVGNCQGRGEHTHLWGFLPFGVRLLFVVPNPAGSLTTPIQVVRELAELHSQSCAQKVC